MPRTALLGVSLAVSVATSGAAETRDAGCPGGVHARSEHLSLCLRSETGRSRATVSAAPGIELSAEVGLDFLDCTRRGAACRSVALQTGSGEAFPPVVSFDLPGLRTGRHRLEYGACDKGQEVCVPGDLSFEVPPGR